MNRDVSEKFLWGTATAAYQIEGAIAADGKGPSIWDVFAATPGRIAAGDSGAVACDHYHRWREDIKLMRELQLRAYRFSVSWPRIFPRGRGIANAPGLDFYDRLVDGLIAAGIEPCVTLYHWDLPAALQDELGGWTHPDTARHFADYAQVVYERLGDRVPRWITLNEPWVVAVEGHTLGTHPPAIKDRRTGYLVGHNLLRAHAYAVAAYRTSRCPRGQIGLAHNTVFAYPASPSSADADAAERLMLNFGGWFSDPPITGDYPAVLRQRLGSLLPEFTTEDQRALKGSLDFLGLNYYTSAVARHAAGVTEMEYEWIPQPQRVHTEMHWPVDPEGLYHLLLWLSRRYPSMPIYITENGAAFSDEPDESGFVDDQHRIQYLRDHFQAATDAVAAGVDLRGYFVWSLLDNLEWAHGFAKRFGLIRCDFATQKRTIKASGRWLAQTIANGRFTPRSPLVIPRHGLPEKTT